MHKQLTLTLHAHWFNEILSGRKKNEYREKTPYWVTRLLNSDGSPRHYDTIYFKNGYAKDAPVMIVEYKGLTIDDCFDIQLGDVINKLNISNLNQRQIEKQKKIFEE